MYKRNLVFIAGGLGILLLGIGIMTLGSVTPELKAKFQMNDIQSGTLFSILPIGILVGSLLFGPICDRYGYKVLLVVTCIFIVAGFLGIAYSPSIGLLKAFIFLFGIGGGAINGATSAAVADISTNAKGANLSLMGVFYGIGALGMPFVLGSLKNRFTYDQILFAAGMLTLSIAIYFALIAFPPAKISAGFPISRAGIFFRDAVIILIGFFLFCQSSFEAIINNWTTTYLSSQKSFEVRNALYALSLYVGGLTAMRLLIGTVFRKVSFKTLLLVSLALIFCGNCLLSFGEGAILPVTGLVLIGAGLSGGFPIMLGLVANRYAEQSGTAFSFVLVIALIGNMLINYLVGLIVQYYGIQHLTTVAFVETVVMSGLVLSIIKLNK